MIAERAPIQAHPTRLPSEIVRRTAVFRLFPGCTEVQYQMHLQRLRNEFARLRPGLKGDEFHRLFDRWLENKR